MDFGKLSQAEKLAVYGSIAAIVGGVVGALSGLLWLTVLAAIAMLAVVFLPQLSPNTQLPGSKGSLMLICGGVAAAAAVLALLTFIGAIDFWFRISPLQSILFLVGVGGGLLMGWAGWQAFQAEGGKFTVGTSSTGAAAGARDDRAAAPPESTPTAEPARDEPAASAPREEGAAGAPPPREPAAGTPPESTDEERRDPDV
jgi:hypothetical protein